MNEKIYEIAERIKGMRELLEITADEMSVLLKISPEEYAEYETGARDFSFSLLYEIARRFGIDITELISGELPRLSRLSFVRSGEGLPIERRKGFAYQHMAYLYKNRRAEPFRVVAKYDAELENKPIVLGTHAGQEFNYVVSGRILLQVENHIVEMGPGDAVYYDGESGHGMVATGGEDCVFLAVISENGKESGK